MSQLQAAQFLSAAQQYLKLGQHPQAIEMLQRAVAAAPGSFAALSLLGIANQAVGNFEGAVTNLRAALGLQNSWAEGHELLGRVYAGRAMYDAAAESFRKAVELKPKNVEAINNLGTVLRSLSRYDEAIEHLRVAVKLRPDQAEIHNNLGNALLESGQTMEALAELQQAVSLRPDYVVLYQGLGNSLIFAGRIDEAIDCYRRALTIDPTNSQIHSSLLMSMHYTDSANENPIELFEEHVAYDRKQIANLRRPSSYPNDRDLNRRLRIGYVSPDLRRHSVASFIEPILAHHDQAKFEVICYADVANPDSVTAQLQKQVPHWRSISGLSDDQIAEQIRRDQVDILIDLSGHTGGGRLPIFGRKPAPVQATYLGYPNTTGLSVIDFRITDSIADPPGEADVLCSEKLCRMEPPFLCFAPPLDSPDISALPALQNNYITFGSFNSLPKITPGTIKLWAAALNAVTDSHLLIKARGLQHPAIADWLAGEFAEHGVARDRLRFLGHETSTSSHLMRYHEVDIALDTFPYNGATTTCEAMWIGVPVVSLRGRIHSARVGASLLTTIGHGAWIADTADEFVRIASNLATDRRKLTEHRAALREQFKASPLTDGAAFTRRFEAALREMWRCAMSKQK